MEIHLKRASAIRAPYRTGYDRLFGTINIFFWTYIVITLLRVALAIVYPSEDYSEDYDPARYRSAVTREVTHEARS